MIPGFGKQSITVGTGDCDVRIGGPGVGAEHARIALEPDGSLVFYDNNQGKSSAHGQPLPPGGSAKWDFRTQFVVGEGTVVPMTHPAITLMLMEQGKAPLKPGELTIGRDVGRVNIALKSPAVSSRHALVNLQPLAISDLGSTSGTWLGQYKLEPNRASPIEPNGIVAIGPIPVAAQTLLQLGAALGVAPAPQMTGQQSAVGGQAGGFAGAAGAAGAAGVSGAPAHTPTPGKKHQTVIGQVAISGGQQNVKSIGRTPDNDIVIAHAQVSSKHASLHKAGQQLFLEDHGSANGTYVRGQRIPAGQRVPVQNGEKVFIGPMPLLLQVEAEEVAMVVEDSAQWAGRPLYEIEAWDLVLTVPDRDNPSEMKTLLDHVSFKAMPGDLIALMGPSGAGKTTLLLALNGYLPPSAGQVRINGEDLYSIYDALRGSIGYVPQDDIVHPELTVWEAVRYSAKMRLPPDYSEEEIDRQVHTTLAQLGLEQVMHLQIGKPEKKVLSGGQRKRVNIAMELVTDPVLMFLDEPTSGLAADDTTALVQLLADLARQTGKTIISTIHQPAKEEFEKFNLALVLGQGGIPIFYGPTSPDAYRFFGSYLERQGKPNDIDNPRDMFDMLNQREGPIFEAMKAQNAYITKFQATQAAAREWNAEFFNPQNPTFQKMYSGRRSVGTGSEQQGVPKTRRKAKGQFGLLFGRYLRVKVRDVGGTAIMLLQAPIIGALFALVFGGQKDAIPYWCLGAMQELSRKADIGGGGDDVLRNLSSTPDHSGPLFFMVVAAAWFGTSNAAREIVSERAIYLRERMVNLTLFNYVVTKFLLLSFFVLIQCTILLAIVFFSLGFNGGPQAFGIELGIMFATGVVSAAAGLLISTVVTSSEAAMALTPIALLPQVVLGGLMVPITTNPLLEYPMWLMPVRWGFEGVVAQERLAIRDNPAWIIDLKKPDTTSLPDFVEAGKFKCAEAQIASSEFNGAWGFTAWEEVWIPPAVLSGMVVVTLIVILLVLKRRDRI